MRPRTGDLPLESVPPSALIDHVRTACLLECTARKPGNVHPEASFVDLCYDDFTKSADVVAPILADANARGVGRTVFDAVVATREAVGRNTNLGIVLLVAPLAAVPGEAALSAGVDAVLQSLTVEDAEFVYRAIRTAEPGGMGSVSDGDVQSTPTGTLREMMQLAADRDAVALQYATGFDLVLNAAVPELVARWDSREWETAVVGLHLHLAAVCPDTLIARKCGVEVARDAAARARSVLDAGWPRTEAGRQRLAEFDRWLRSDGHRRNPGCTADLVTAALFAALRDGAIAVEGQLGRIARD